MKLYYSFFLTMSLTVFSFMGLHNIALADLKGKSIHAKSRTDFILCNPTGRCKRTKTISSTSKIYIAKDGKNIFDYISNQNGDLIVNGGRKVKSGNGALVWGKQSGNKITVHARTENVELVVTLTLVGNSKCRINKVVKWHQPGWSAKNTRILQPSCRVYEGNKFAK